MRVYLRLRDHYIGIDPTPVAGKVGDAAFPVYTNRKNGGAWEEVELTQLPSDKFSALFVAANRVLTLNTYGIFESREFDKVGPWEQFVATDQPPFDGPDSISLLYQSINGTLNAALTIEEKP